MGIYTYMHTYICIYIQTYIHPNAYMHTHKQSGVLSQSRHTSRSGRRYIKVCGPKKAEGSAIWNDLILFLPLDTCWANRETGKVWSLSRRGHKPNSWTPSYKFMKAKSLIFFTTCELKKAVLLMVLVFFLKKPSIINIAFMSLWKKMQLK